MRMIRYLFFICVCGLALLSCEPKNKIPNPAGEIDVTNILYIGDGQMGGYMNDGFTKENQENSLANILATQMKFIAAPTSNIPFLDGLSIGVSVSGLAPFHLSFKTDCKGVSSLSPVRTAAVGDLSCLTQNVYQANHPFHVFGIPGLKSNQFTNTNLSASNAFFQRMSSSPNASLLNELTASPPSFFQLYIGLEDVLDFAKSGGTHETLPTELEFQQNYEQILFNLTSSGAKGVVASIPDVSQMPYFTTIPWNGLTLDDSNLGTLNSIYNPLGFYFQLGANPFMMVDSTANMFAVRQIQSTELLLLSLPLDSVKCNQMGVLFPIRDEFILDAGELNTLRNKIEAYNAIIRNVAQQYQLAVVNTEQFISKLKDGFVYNGVSMSAKFVSGGAYSLDGIYLNPRGNALFANEFIKAINQKYHSSIPQANALKYDGIRFP